MHPRLMMSALLALSLGACGDAAPPPNAARAAPALETHTVELRAAARERVWDGVVEAVEQATLSAQTGGRVLELPFDVNDYVQAGEVVVRFTDVEQQSGQRRAQAALAAANAAYKEAQADFTRIAEIYERKLVPRAQYDQSVARRDAARAQLDAARAVVSEAGEQVDYTVIRAPYTGILIERHVQIGETVRPGQALVSGLSLDKLRVNVDVPQSDVDALRRHARAAILLADGRRVEVATMTVFPYADPATHSFKVRLDLAEAATGLHPGMTVKAAFVLDDTQVLRIPEVALVRRSEVTAVYVVDAERVALRQVRVGQRVGEEIEILAGLSAGERIARDPLAARLWLAQALPAEPAGE